jgi:hypothetical protein
MALFASRAGQRTHGSVRRALKLVPLLTALLTGANWTYTVASTDSKAAPDPPAEMSQPVGTVQARQPSAAITLRQMEKTAATPKNGIGSLLS